MTGLLAIDAKCPNIRIETAFRLKHHSRGIGRRHFWHDHELVTLRVPGPDESKRGRASSNSKPVPSFGRADLLPFDQEGPSQISNSRTKARPPSDRKACLFPRCALNHHPASFVLNHRLLADQDMEPPGLVEGGIQAQRVDGGFD